MRLKLTGRASIQKQEAWAAARTRGAWRKMSGNKKSIKEIRALRECGGKWLKTQRERVGFSQRALASALKLPYYTFISQVENGSARISPSHYEVWATALDIPIKQFTHAMLRYYDPVVFNLLFAVGTSQTSTCDEA
jgi:ribosome-binding protein aMBF1 (putative translation factor)